MFMLEKFNKFSQLELDIPMLEVEYIKGILDIYKGLSLEYPTSHFIDLAVSDRTYPLSFYVFCYRKYKYSHFITPKTYKSIMSKYEGETLTTEIISDIVAKFKIDSITL